MNSTNDARIKKNSLSDLCVYFDAKNSRDEETGLVDKFVGLRFVEGKLSVHFPVGYEKPKNQDEKQIRLDILNLISILSSFGTLESSLRQTDISLKPDQVIFPIHAYLFVISDFLNHGYYKPKEQIYKHGTTGKINWSRTIKQVRPQITNENVVYLEFITQRTKHNEDELISQIHKYCVYESFSKLGYLFSSFIPAKPAIAFNKNFFTSILQTKLAHTFNEKELLLFKNMLEIILYLDSSSNKENFIYGTNNFHHIWEQLVDSVYGEKDKDKFYPKVYWRLKGNKSDFLFGNSEKRNSLRPDSIMIQERGKPEQKIFVLDSKYYQYGSTKNPNHLPDSASVVKQIAYAKYIDTSENQNKLPQDVRQNIDSSKIYNAFILPSSLKTPQKTPQNIGFVSADYVLPQDSKICQKPYHKIHGILLDIRTLMYSHSPHNNQAIDDLAKIIVGEDGGDIGD